MTITEVPGLRLRNTRLKASGGRGLRRRGSKREEEDQEILKEECSTASSVAKKIRIEVKGPWM